MSRRLITVLLVVLAVVGLGYLAAKPFFKHALDEVTLPLKHEDIIRQQAKKKQLDPALIAAVIYAESKFRDSTSSAGARGLMQILPSTAKFIAKRSGGTAFVDKDLATPQVNISYGSYYLRYLIARYGGNEGLAVAAYNAGEANVDKWLTDASKTGTRLTVERIPFAETRAYVAKVKDMRKRYREKYAKELGLE